MSDSDPLDRFCALVVADVSRHEKLREIDDTDLFIASVLNAAREYGFDLSPGAVRAAMRGHLPGMAGLINSVVSETPLPPADWLPVNCSWQGAELYVHWSFFGKQRLRVWQGGVRGMA